MDARTSLEYRDITLHDPPKNDILSRMEECKKRLILYKCPLCTKREIRAITCKIRLCSKCEPERKRRVYKNIMTQLEGSFKANLRSVSLLTLTEKGHHKFTRVRKKKFDEQVRKLHRKFGFVGVKVLETKYKGDGLFYYHYHLLIMSAYIPQRDVSTAWQKISGSPVVDIRRVSFFHGLGYVVKYAASPLGTCTIEDAVKCDLYEKHVKRARMYSIMGMRTVRVEPEKPIITCSNCGSVMESVGTIDVREIGYFVAAIFMKASDSYQGVL